MQRDGCSADFRPWEYDNAGRFTRSECMPCKPGLVRFSCLKAFVVKACSGLFVNASLANESPSVSNRKGSAVSTLMRGVFLMKLDAN